MPEKKTIRKAQKLKREGKAPSTQASEFVHEEIERIRVGKHGAKNAKQAIAIGLSKAREAGVKLPKAGAKKTASATKGGRIAMKKTSLKKSPATSVSTKALSAQTKKAAVKRGPAARHTAAMKAVKTKGKTVMRSAGQKAAKTRAAHR
ncbi:MAG TPA: DUF6496 domain-containing protein [Bacteriovoracaceae bacterium]|nr:DUF6496 domain-containing protein [Bacteriovoracaceae bacterium]